MYELVATLWYGALSGRLREIAILSAASASDARYALDWHILDGEEARLTAPEVQAIISDDPAAVLPADEAALSDFARALTADARVDDAAFDAVAQTLDERQMVELTMIAGL